MKFKRLMLLSAPFLMTLMVFGLILFSPTEALADQTSVTLSQVKGEVLLRTGGGQHEVQAVDGTKMVQGDWLRTGKTGTVKLIYEDGTEATIGSNSLLNLQRLTTKDSDGAYSSRSAHITAWKDGHQSSIELWAGSIWSKVKSLVNIDDQYEVETPTAVMGVRGTLYLVSVDPQTGSTEGDVIDGTIGVGQNRERTQSAPIQLVTMGKTLRLVSLNEPLPNQRIIDPQELIKSTQSEILVQLVNDVAERTQELTGLTKEQQQAYKLSGNVEDIKAAIGTSAKLVELIDFGKEFMNTLQTSVKVEEVKQVLSENNQTIEQVNKTLDSIKVESDKTRKEVLEIAKQDAELSQQVLEDITNEATGNQSETGSVTDPTSPPAPETPTVSTSGHRDNGDTVGQNPAEPLDTPVQIYQSSPVISFSNGVKLDLSGLTVQTGATVKVSDVGSTIQAQDLPSGMSLAGKVVDVSLTNVDVTSPVTITLPISSDADPTKVGVFYRDGSTWKYQDSTVVGGTVVATVNHFSTYGVLALDGTVSQEAYSLSPDGKQISISFDKDLNPQSIPVVTDFAVTDNNQALGVNSLSINGKILTMNLASPVYKNDHLKVKYTVGSRHLRDIDGNSVQEFEIHNFNTSDLPGPEVVADNPGTDNVRRITLNIYDKALSSHTLALSRPEDIIQGSKIFLNPGGDADHAVGIAVSSVEWGPMDDNGQAELGYDQTLTLTLSSQQTFNVGDTLDVFFVRGAVMNSQGEIVGAMQTEGLMPSAPSFKVYRDEIVVQSTPGAIINLYTYNDDTPVGQSKLVDNSGSVSFSSIIDGDYYLTQTLSDVKGLPSEHFFAGPSSRQISGRVLLPEGMSAASDIYVQLGADCDQTSLNGSYYYAYSIVLIPRGSSSSDTYTYYVPSNSDSGYRVTYYLPPSADFIQRGYFAGNNGTSPYYSSASQVDVSSANQTGVNVTLLSGAKITGTVSLKSGTAAEDMRVNVDVSSDEATTTGNEYFYGGTEVVIHAGTNVSAEYTLSVPVNRPGTGYKIGYDLYSRVDGLIGYAYYGGSKGMQTNSEMAKLVDVSSGEQRGINLTLIEGKIISGSISLPPNVVNTSGIGVNVEAWTDNGTPDETSDDYGSSRYVTIESGAASVHYNLTVLDNASGYNFKYYAYLQDFNEQGWYKSGEGSSTVMTANYGEAGRVDVSTNPTLNFIIGSYSSTSPALSLQSAVLNPFTASLNAITNEDCSLYYVALLKVDDFQQQPTPEQIMNWDSSGNMADSWWGSFNPGDTLTLQGLTPNSDYIVYVVAQASDGRCSGIQSSEFHTPDGIEAKLVPTGNPDGLHEGQTYREFKMMDGDMAVDLSAVSGKTLTVSYNQGTPQPLDLNSDTTLWFNTAHSSGEYIFVLKNEDGIYYKAVLYWDPVAGGGTGGSSPNPPTNASFSDTDMKSGRIEGRLTWDPPADATSIQGYLVYFMDQNGNKMASPIVNRPVSLDCITMLPPLSIPSNAVALGVFSYNDIGDSDTGALITLADNYSEVSDTTPPTLSAVTAGPLAIGSDVSAASNEAGNLILVPSTATPILSSLYSNSNTRVAFNVAANAPASFSTAGLPSGIYVVYAVDLSENLSEPSEPISIGTVVRADNTALSAANVQYCLNYNPSNNGELAAGSGTITVTFPTGYSLPQTIAKTNVSVGGWEPSDVSVSGQVVVMTMPSNLTLVTNANTILQIVFLNSAGIGNPAAEGLYTFSIHTSSETTDVMYDVDISSPDIISSSKLCGSLANGYYLDSSGEIWAWGEGSNGELGNGTTNYSTIPVKVSNLSGMTSIASKGRTGYALDSLGDVWTWGDGSEGELANGATNVIAPNPVKITGLSNIAAISAGLKQGYALDDNGHVWAWGDSEYGELGNGSTNNSSLPVQVSNLSNIVAIAAGHYTGYALDNAGQVWAWGYGGDGEIGNGATDNVPTPIQISNLSNIVAIGAGTVTGYALDDKGRVWAWGNGSDGELGNGTQGSSTIPVLVSNLPNIKAIAGAWCNGFALDNSGSVWTWGGGADGLNGNGTTSINTTPIQVQISNIVDIAAGQCTAYALDDAGKIWAWGWGGAGNLGNDSQSDSDVPVEVLINSTLYRTTEAYNTIVASVPTNNDNGIYTNPSWTEFETAIADCDLTLTAFDGQEFLEWEITAIQDALNLLELAANVDTNPYKMIVASIPTNNDSGIFTDQSWSLFETEIANRDLTLTAADGQAALDAEVISIQAILNLLEPNN